MRFLSTLSLRRATVRKGTAGRINSNFYPRSPCGERQIPLLCFPTIKIFLSTLSLRRATSSRHIGKTRSKHFYPRSPCGERLDKIPNQCQIDQFLSTLSLRRVTTQGVFNLFANPDFYPRSPCGERLHERYRLLPVSNHFYPRSPCGERHSDPVTDKAWALISIHALLAESDLQRQIEFERYSDISIHALLAESDCLLDWDAIGYTPFLSTLSLRRATAEMQPLAPRSRFLSTLSLRRATASQGADFGHKMNFYPRSPCGERLLMLSMVVIPISFLSTLSLRRATGSPHGGIDTVHISIHALLAESDRMAVSTTFRV